MFGLFSKPKRAPTDDAEPLVAEALWEGDIGQALIDAGLSPEDEGEGDGDGEGNVSNSPDAHLDTQWRSHEARLAQENARIAEAHPGCSVAAQFILTDEVWSGRHADLLQNVLELTPYWPPNTRLLPADAVSAEALGLPVHYDGPFGRVLQVADAHIDLIVARAGIEDVAAADEAVKDAMRRDLAALADYYYEEAILPMLRGA
jgi:hypothetical protein